MAHRLYNIPMKEQDCKEGKNYNLQAAKINGFSQKFSHEILKKHEHKKNIQSLTPMVQKEN